MRQPLNVQAKGSAALNVRADTVSVAQATATRKPRFSIVAYNGGPLSLPNWPLPIILDFAGMDVSAQQIPALYNHTPIEEEAVGQSDRVVVERLTGRLLIDGELYPTNARAQRIISRSKEGFAWQASVGASASEVEEYGPGESVTVNGRAWPGPGFVARKSVVREITFCVIGADAGTQVTVTAAARLNTKGSAAMTFEEWLLSMGFDASKLDDAQRLNMQNMYNKGIASGEIAPKDATPPPADPNAPAPAAATAPVAATAVAATRAVPVARPVQANLPLGIPVPSVAELRRELAGEFARSREIHAIAARFADVTVESSPGVRVPLGEHAIAAGWSANDTELHGLRNSRARGPHFAAHDSKQDGATIEAALLRSVGLREDRLAKLGYKPATIEAAFSPAHRNTSISSLMFGTIAAAGLHARPGRISDDTIRTAFRADAMLNVRADGFSTISLSGILGNVANKALVDSYTAVETVWQKICAQRSHSDFKTVTRYRLDSTGAFKKVGPDGELKHIGLSSGSFTNAIETYGAMIALTRQMQINDDLGAFLEIPTLIGRMSALRIEEAVAVKLLANTSSFWGTGNKNYMSGGGSVLAAAGMTTIRQKFRDMVDSNAKPIGTSPKIMLIGSALEQTAYPLLESETLVSGNTTAAPNKNPHYGLGLEVVVWPYLNNTSILDQDGAAITGQSSTAWWLFADPNVRASLAVAFLNGQSMPTIENAETDFNTLGMQWRGYHDFGVGYEDSVASVMSAGA